MRAHPRPSEQGSSIIEFALSAIVLFTLIFGCVGLTLAFYTYEVVSQYARDASRYAIVHGNGCTHLVSGASSPCSIATSCTPNAGATAYVCAGADTALATYLNNEIFPGINGNSLLINTTYTYAPGRTSCTIANCNGAGDQVTVTVSYPFLYALPFIPQRAFTMNASSTMVISQ